MVEEANNRRIVYVLIEFGPKGTLFDLMADYNKRSERFTEPQVVKLAKAINNDLAKLHAHGLTHFDLKLENLLFFSFDVVKLCDFGSLEASSIDFS